jgi:hypothetical protein
MRETERLIKEFAHSGHPLGRGITPEEVPPLIEQLAERLGDSSRRLNLTPSSLKALSKLLVDLHSTFVKQNEAIGDVETIQLVREVAAYIGQVFVVNTRGQWRNSGDLWGTEIVLAGPVEGVKTGEVRQYRNSVASLGQIAASTWDAVIAGTEPKLHRVYQNVIATRAVEKPPKRQANV